MSNMSWRFYETNKIPKILKYASECLELFSKKIKQNSFNKNEIKLIKQIK